MYLPSEDRPCSKTFNFYPTQSKAQHFVLLDQKAKIVPLKAGFGACSKCSCKNFEGNDQQCSNCGHSYGDHW